MNYRKSSPAIIKAWFDYKNNNKGLSLSVSSFVAGYNAAEQSVQSDGATLCSCEHPRFAVRNPAICIVCGKPRRR